MTRIALITGASRGLGAALAERLAATHHIVAVARTVGALEELDDRIQAAGGSATLAPMDVTRPEAMAQLCRGIYDRWGHADLWAHAAIHAAPLSPAPHIDAKDMTKSIDTNVSATATLIQMVAPLLAAAEDGQALFFDDPRAGQKFFGAYGATKA
ncbi:MAG: SDR family NAD(P)-dependent oxidoreductase, partial [Roseovarius confluentis]